MRNIVWKKKKKNILVKLTTYTMSCDNTQGDYCNSDSKCDNIGDGDDNSHIDQKYLDKQSRTIGTYGL